MSFGEEYLDDHHECRGEIHRQRAEITRLTAALDEVQAARRRGDEICAALEISLDKERHEVNRLRDVIMSGQIQRRLLNDMANAGCNCGPHYGCRLAQRRLSEMNDMEKS